MINHAYAVTGGIATGKSTVSRLLKQQDFSVIDADIIAKKQLKNSKVELRNLFGDDIFKNDEIIREKLADIIFSKKEQRVKLNALIHPKVRLEIFAKAQNEERKKMPYFIDIPLFFESGAYDCNMSIVVYAPKDIQLERLMARDNLSIDEARKRVESQMSIEKKKKLADWVIDNSKDLKHLQAEVDKLVEYIRGQYASNKV